MTWALASAKTLGGSCVIIYSETTQVDGKDVVETRTVKHDQSSDQNDTQWHANIKREIVADLSDLNKDDSLPAETDITSLVKMTGKKP